MLDNIKHIILVMSTKGGVGKSTISSQLAMAFKEKGFKVGLLDIDLCGPSIPYLMGIEEKDVHQAEEGWIPIYTDSDKSLAVMSVGFLLKNRNDPVIWRGPKKTSIIKQFLNDVKWDELDYLIIDTPPGTSDEHMTITECIKDHKSQGAVLVTTPQQISLEDVRKAVSYCKRTETPIYGIIENMSSYICPNCKDCTNIFASGGASSLAQLTNLMELGSLPIDTRISLQSNDTIDERSIFKKIPNSTIADVLLQIVDKLINVITSKG